MIKGSDRAIILAKGWEKRPDDLMKACSRGRISPIPSEPLLEQLANPAEKTSGRMRAVLTTFSVHAGSTDLQNPPVAFIIDRSPKVPPERQTSFRLILPCRDISDA